MDSKSHFEYKDDPTPSKVYLLKEVEDKSKQIYGSLEAMEQKREEQKKLNTSESKKKPKIYQKKILKNKRKLEF